MKNNIKTFKVMAIAFAAVIGLSMFTGCKAQTSGAVPNQLVGTWSDSGIELFRITPDRKFYISGSDYEYVIMSSSTLNDASGTILVGSSNTEIGRLNYQISGGIMTLISGTAAFEPWSRMQLTGGGGGSSSGGEAVPNQLVGTWSDSGVEFFRITPDRKFYMGGSDLEFTVMSSSTLGAASGTIVVGYMNAESGRINYSISGSRMTIISGTDALAIWSGIVLTK